MKIQGNYAEQLVQKAPHLFEKKHKDSLSSAEAIQREKQHRKKEKKRHKNERKGG